MEYIITIIIGYIIGCSHMSYYISKFKNINIKENGSKNYGASNTVALVGWKAGILVAIHDIGKAIISVILSKTLFPNIPYIDVIVGVSCIIGHIFPFYLGFDGGKGFASFIGMTIALNWKFAIILIIVILILTLLTDYIVSGTFFAITATPLYIGISSSDYIPALIILISSLIIFYKHKQNIINLKNGTEMRFSKAKNNEYKKGENNE